MRPQRDRSPWTVAEDRLLEAQVLAGIALEDVAALQRRTQVAVARRIQRLGLRLQASALNLDERTRLVNALTRDYPRVSRTRVLILVDEVAFELAAALDEVAVETVEQHARRRLVLLLT